MVKKKEKVRKPKKKKKKETALVKLKNETTSNVLVSRELSDTMALGSIFAKSGMFTDIKTQAQAVVKILAGRELNLTPLESMSNIYIVKDHVALQSKLIASLIKKSGKYDYTVDELTNENCVISFYEFEKDYEGKIVRKNLLGKSSFNRKDAAAASLLNKDNWRNYPRNCYFGRALTNGARWYTPDVFTGYVPEELEATVSENKKLIKLEGDEVIETEVVDTEKKPEGVTKGRVKINSKGEVSTEKEEEEIK